MPEKSSRLACPREEEKRENSKNSKYSGIMAEEKERGFLPIQTDASLQSTVYIQPWRRRSASIVRMLDCHVDDLEFKPWSHVGSSLIYVLPPC